MRKDALPTEQESIECAAVFVLASQAENTVQATDILADYLGDDSGVGSIRLWSLVTVGAYYLGESTRRRNPNKLGDIGFYYMQKVGPETPPIDDLNAMRLVALYANRDWSTGQDLLVAHRREHGEDGMIGILDTLVRLYRSFPIPRADSASS